MSLIQYKPNSEWSVILHNELKRALVLYNRHTGETALVNDYLINPSIDLSTEQLQYLSSMEANSKDLVTQSDHIIRGEASSRGSIDPLPYCQYCGQFITKSRHNSNSIFGAELPEVDSPRRYSETYEDSDDLNDSIYSQYEFDSTNPHMVTLPMPKSFVSRDYFLLLDSNQPPVTDNNTSGNNDVEGLNQKSEEPIYASISESAFSQGYFNKFFKSKKVLGRGARGSVYLVEHILDGVSLGLFACKKVSIGDDHQWLEKVLHEVNLLRVISHSNLVKYNHVWLENSSTTAFGPAVPCAYILQEYCAGGTLEDYVKKRTQAVGSTQLDIEKIRLQRRRRRKSMAEGKSGILEDIDCNKPQQLSLPEIYSIMKDITLGVSQLHKSRIIHRDLKPSNCLLSQEITDDQDARSCSVLVSDFGEGQVEGKPRSATGVTGTLEYCAPELLKIVEGEFGQFSTKSDIFSLGMILHFLLFSRLPYQHDPTNQASTSTVSETQSPRVVSDFDGLRSEVVNFSGFDIHNLPERVGAPDGLYQLLARMVSSSPQERPTAIEVLNSLDKLSNNDNVLSQHERVSNMRNGVNTTNADTAFDNTLGIDTYISSRALSSARQRATIRSNALAEAAIEKPPETPLTITDLSSLRTANRKTRDLLQYFSLAISHSFAGEINVLDWSTKGLLILLKMYSIYRVHINHSHGLGDNYTPLIEGVLLISLGMELQARSRRLSIYYFMFHCIVVFVYNRYLL